MRIAVFGSPSEMTLRPLEALAQHHEIVAVVRTSGPGAPLRRLTGSVARALGLMRRDSLGAWAHQRSIPCLAARKGDDASVIADLRRRHPDLYCISAFRHILGPELLALAPLGALNLHPSLLPRHRGPVPWFWVYYRDDREAGVTVHWVTERLDAGDIVAQHASVLERGLSVDVLGERCAREGARLLADAVARVESGSAPRRVQDEAQATPAPLVRAGSRMVDFAAWGAERIWHFLAGLNPRFREPLLDVTGGVAGYAGILGYELTSERGRPIGRVTRETRSLALHCRDGLVWLDGDTAA